jgi:hypothetical protein
VVKAGFLLAPHGRGVSLALGFGQKLGAPRIKRRLQPDVQFHAFKDRSGAGGGPRLSGQV